MQRISTKFLIYAPLICVFIIYIPSFREKLKFTLKMPLRISILGCWFMLFIHNFPRMTHCFEFIEGSPFIHWIVLVPFQLAITVCNMYQSCIPLWPYCLPIFALPSVLDDIGTRRRHSRIWWMLPNMPPPSLWWSLRTNFTLQRVSEAKGVRVRVCGLGMGVGVWGVFVKTQHTWDTDGETHYACCLWYAAN